MIEQKRKVYDAISEKWVTVPVKEGEIAEFLPVVTSNDNGKILKVDEDGNFVLMES